jgi:hypothetical protein
MARRQVFRKLLGLPPAPVNSMWHTLDSLCKYRWLLGIHRTRKVRDEGQQTKIRRDFSSMGLSIPPQFAWVATAIEIKRIIDMPLPAGGFMVVIALKRC